MTNKLFSIVAIITMALLGGCATTQFSGFSHAPLAQAGVVHDPAFNNGKMPERALQALKSISTTCQDQLFPQMAGPGQSMLNGAIPGGFAGAAGLGIGYPAAIKGITPITGVILGGVSGLFNGAWSGGELGSAGAAGSIGSCIDKMWEGRKKYGGELSPENDFSSPEFHGTYVVTITAGKAWGDPTTNGAVKVKHSHSK